MLGIIFTNLLDMVEEKMGYSMVDDVLITAGVDGSYTGIGHYDFSELVTILNVLSDKTELPVDTLLQTYGEYLFHKLMAGHAALLPPDIGMLDLLSELDSNIHVEVLKLYPNATLPTFSVAAKTPTHIDLIYRSPRQLQELAVGLIKGASVYFDTSCDISLKALENIDNEVLISVKLH